MEETTDKKSKDRKLLYNYTSISDMLTNLHAEITASILRKFAENKPFILRITCGIWRKRVSLPFLFPTT